MGPHSVVAGAAFGVAGRSSVPSPHFVEAALTAFLDWQASRTHLDPAWGSGSLSNRATACVLCRPHPAWRAALDAIG